MSSALPLLRRTTLAALLLAGAAPLAAQDQATDPELETLIPDSAVENPEDWARGENPPTEVPEIDPAAPLAELPPPMVAWPEDMPPLAAPEPLAPDPDIQLAEQERQAEPAVLAGGDVWTIAQGVEIAFPESAAELPERRRIAARFTNLSALVTLAGREDDNIAQVVVRARSDRQLLERLMRIHGYYDAQVIQTVGGIEPGQEAATQDARVRFDVVPGTRYRFGAIELPGLAGAGEHEPLLRDNYLLRSGDPVSTDAILDERKRLQTAMDEGGFAFATTGEPDLLIDHTREEGDLTQPVSPGGRYVFGALTSSDPRFLPPDHLAQIARFEPGQLYRRSAADDLRQAVLATGLVSTLTVTPRETEAPAAGNDGTVALDVAFTPGPLRTLAGAAGYDSGEGVRLEASWEHRNLFPPEGMLRLRGVLGTKEQLAGVTFRRNNFRGRDQVLTLDFYASNVNRTAYAARTLALTGSFERVTTILFRKPLTWAAGFEVLLSDEREAKVVGGPLTRLTYAIAGLPARVAFDGSDDFLDPSSGLRAALRVAPELSLQSGRTSAYARIQADASYYFPVGNRVVLATRARLGTIPGTALANIAPSRRLYAGGGGSVRGYGYQLIGPRDVLGEPSGGRSLAEFSIEARIRTGLFGGAVSLVPFVDAGAVDEAVFPTLRDVRFGAGIGLRWATGFGPIRVDVGTPINRRPGESRIAVYVALGQAF